MKYIITESKLEKVITDYLNELFDVDNINYTNVWDYDDDTAEEWEDENRIEFYLGDYAEDETCFRWYGCGAFIEGSESTTKCPVVQVEYKYEKNLNGYFGDTWHEPFKNWFYKHFDLKIKSVS